MEMFGIGDRVGSKYNKGQGTVRRLLPGLLVEVEWDHDTTSTNYYRTLRPLPPEEDKKNQQQPLTINEEAHGHE